MSALSDLGLTHVALPVSNLAASLSFYARYARMEVVHHRRGTAAGSEVAWISDGTRPFVVVLIVVAKVENPLRPLAHLGVGCASREEVDRLCDEARAEGALCLGPVDAGYPVGYWALLSDPDGHTLEISHGQEVGLVVEGHRREQRLSVEGHRREQRLSVEGHRREQKADGGESRGD